MGAEAAAKRKRPKPKRKKLKQKPRCTTARKHKVKAKKAKPKARRSAYGMFEQDGERLEALSAAKRKARKRSVDTRDELTPQEQQIGRLARDGLSNVEISAQL